MVGMGDVGMGDMPIAGVGAASERMTAPAEPLPDDDFDAPHLRSTGVVTGYHVQATDGPIGHVENFLLETDDWGIRYLVIETQNWWAGQQVLFSPTVVTGIDRSNHDVHVAATTEQVKSSPPWGPATVIDESYRDHLHGHYGR